LTDAEGVADSATALIVGGAGTPAVGDTCGSAGAVHALLSLCAAVEAAATVILVSLKVYAPAFAAGLSRPTAVAAAATVALVGLKVYAPLSTASLSVGASVVGPGYPWYGGQRTTYKDTTY
jgi:hypothetical protein